MVRLVPKSDIDTYWLVIVDICILMRRYGDVCKIISSSINNGNETKGAHNITVKRILKSEDIYAIVQI